ncbi:MAG: hypothetical protein ACYTEP_07285 [Planctomycetota bacterium]
MLGGCLLASCQAPVPDDQDLALHWLKDLGGPAATDPLDTEELTFHATPTLEQLDSLASLPRLHTLTIWDEGEWIGPTSPVGILDDASLRVICALPNIHTLVIAGWNSIVTDQGMANLLPAPRLRRVDYGWTIRHEEYLKRFRTDHPDAGFLIGFQ